MLPLQPPTPPPLGDVFSSTRRCANCRRDQKGRIQTIYLLYTPKIDSSGRQNGAHIAKNGLKIIAKLILGIRSALLGSSLRRSEHQEADQAEIERTILENRTKSASRDPPKMEPKSHKNQCQKWCKKSMRLGCAFWSGFSDFGSQLGSKMESSWASKTHCC